MKHCCKYLLIVPLCLFSLKPYAQSSIPIKGPDPGFSNRWSIGLTIGPDFYFGDLNKYKFGISKNVSLSGGLQFQYQITNVIGIRLQLLGSWLNGSITVETDTQTVENSGSL